MSRDRRATGPDDEPMLARWGTERPTAPLVVVLHGNGTSEHSMIEISPWLPHGPVAYAAVRAPFEDGTGYSWYRDATDLAATCAWLEGWLDTEGDPDRPVLVLGFREGVAVAAALMLCAPHRFAGAVLIYGALPFDAGLPLRRGRLSGLPVFLAHGTDDPRTPAALLERTGAWLARDSGAPLWTVRVPGGAQLAGEVVGAVGTWLADRLDHLRTHGENPLPDGDEPPWPTLAGGVLRARAGGPPAVTERIPQHQEASHTSALMRSLLWERLAALDGVSTAAATVGVDGTRSLLLDRSSAAGPDAAFLLPDLGEFAHQHPDPDGSLHVVLPDALAYDALAKGWAVPHPLAGLRLSPGTVLVAAPREAAEVETVAGIAAASHRYATG